MSTEIQVKDLFFVPYIDEARLQARISEMGKAIAEQYRDLDPVFLCILKGAFLFTADLVRAADIPCEVTFTQLRSYEGTASSGRLEVVYQPDISFQGRHVIIVEDIIDTGYTMHRFMPLLLQKEPLSVALTSLLLKPDALLHDIKIDYLGFEIPDRFVVGYGLDYNQRGRELKEIYQLKG